MPTMNVSLTAEFVEFIEREVAAGEYGTASEVVRAALRSLRREAELREEKLAVLRREVGIGATQADAGRFSSRSISDISAAVTREHAED